MLLACRIRYASKGRSRLGWLLCLPPLFLAAPAHSQSLGDVARQQRERKQDQPRRTTHVYTNEDLARPKILQPEDRERFRAAQKKPTPAASEPAAEVAGSDLKTDGLPLGDVARRYRALQQARRKLEPQLRAPLPAMGSQVLAHPTFSRPPVRIAAPPAPPSFVRPQRARAGKAMRSEALSGGVRVRVRPGDTLWKLARVYLGRGTHWLLLAAINPQVTDPTRLQSGAWVRLPDRAPAVRPLKHVRVKRGDSLWKLARALFGNGEAWSCIAQANPQLQNADLIFPGQMLTLPTSCDDDPRPLFSKSQSRSTTYPRTPTRR